MIRMNHNPYDPYEILYKAFVSLVNLTLYKAFVSLVTATASHPVFIFDDSHGMQYSGHLLDLYALLGIVGGVDNGCCTAESWALCDPLPKCNRQGAAKEHFVQEDLDRAETSTMFEIFYQLASNGSMGLRSLGWRSVAEAGAGVVIANNGSQTVLGLREDRCAFWKSSGFGPGFWWSD